MNTVIIIIIIQTLHYYYYHQECMTVNAVPVVISDGDANDGVFATTGCCICCKHSTTQHQFNIRLQYYIV